MQKYKNGRRCSYTAYVCWDGICKDCKVHLDFQDVKVLSFYNNNFYKGSKNGG